MYKQRLFATILNMLFNLCLTSRKINWVILDIQEDLLSYFEGFVIGNNKETMAREVLLDKSGSTSNTMSYMTHENISKTLHQINSLYSVNADSDITFTILTPWDTTALQYLFNIIQMHWQCHECSDAGRWWRTTYMSHYIIHDYVIANKPTWYTCQ